MEENNIIGMYTIQKGRRNGRYCRMDYLPKYFFFWKSFPAMITGIFILQRYIIHVKWFVGRMIDTKRDIPEPNHWH